MGMSDFVGMAFRWANVRDEGIDSVTVEISNLGQLTHLLLGLAESCNDTAHTNVPQLDRSIRAPSIHERLVMTHVDALDHSLVVATLEDLLCLWLTHIDEVE